MAERMTSRERWLAALHLEPVDRLPFWPKLNASYPRAQAEPFRSQDTATLHDWIGSDPHVGVAACWGERRSRTTVETTRQDQVLTTTYRTSGGETRLVQHWDEDSQSWHPVRFPVETRDDIVLMTEIFDDIEVELDPDRLTQAQSQCGEIGNRALTTSSIGESPLMHWVEYLAGVEQAHFLLADWRPQVEGLFAAVHSQLLKKAAVLAEHSPADLLYMIENTSTTLISPDQYHTYCLRHIREYADITQAAGRDLGLHMCGHLKALLPDLATLPVQAFEAFTSPTLGDTDLLDGRTHCTDTCLVGGTNATLWTCSAARIIEQIERDLDALPHHRGIVVTSAGVMPPICPPETIKQVCEWVQAYPARLN